VPHSLQGSPPHKQHCGKAAGQVAEVRQHISSTTAQAAAAGLQIDLGLSGSTQPAAYQGLSGEDQGLSGATHSLQRTKD